MPANHIQLVAACFAMVMLAFIVGSALLFTRVREMRQKRLHPQSIANSLLMAARLENVKVADNFRNLFEVPVLFYALVAMALATGFVPGWLVPGSWLFVALRFAHSFIHCTYNRVYHRLAVFLTSFGLLVAMWVGYVVSLASKAAG